MIADVVSSLLIRRRRDASGTLVMRLAVRCGLLAVNFWRREFGFQREIGGQHQHERCGHAERDYGVEDRKNPTERLMIHGGLRAEVPDAVACRQPRENRNIPADARNFQRAAVSGAD